jgi:hypothetical protein
MTMRRHVLRPDLSDAVSGGIQTRELNSVIRGR